MKRLAVMALAAALGVGNMVGIPAIASSNHCETNDTDTQAQQEIILGEDESTWGPYADEFYAEEYNVILGDDESTWSPFADCDTLADAEKAAGFEVSVPDEISGYAEIHYSAIRNDLIQVDYIADEDHCICIRKGLGTEDISGDWNEYSERQDIEIDGKTVTLQGNNGIASLATWTDGTYAFSVGVYYGSNGVSADVMESVIDQIK